MNNITKWIEFSYLLGFIEMLDAYQRAQGVDDKQRFMKKQFVTSNAIKIILPNTDPVEVNDFMKEIGEMKLEAPLIELMKKKVDRDQIMKVINQAKFDGVEGAKKFDI